MTKLWAWFVVPLGMVPAIGYWHGMGFVALVLLGKGICSKEPLGMLIGSLLAFGTGFFAMLNMQP